jgi:hypothetical protein
LCHMPSTFAHEFKTPTFKAKVAFRTGLFINSQFVDGSDNTTIEYDLPLSLINHLHEFCWQQMER